MGDEIVPPARRTLETQLNAVRFVAGVQDGRWEVLKLAWPHLYVRVTGRAPESSQTFTHDFRLECTGYPDPGPLVNRWSYVDDIANGSLAPAPSEPASPGYLDAMKEWQGGEIYRAWSRNAASHGDWAKKRPDQAWHLRREIVFIMEELHALVTEQAVFLATRR